MEPFPDVTNCLSALRSESIASSQSHLVRHLDV